MKVIAGEIKFVIPIVATSVESVEKARDFYLERLRPLGRDDAMTAHIRDSITYQEVEVKL